MKLHSYVYDLNLFYMPLEKVNARKKKTRPGNQKGQNESKKSMYGCLLEALIALVSGMLAIPHLLQASCVHVKYIDLTVASTLVGIAINSDRVRVIGIQFSLSFLL